MFIFFCKELIICVVLRCSQSIPSVVVAVLLPSVPVPSTARLEYAAGPGSTVATGVQLAPASVERNTCMSSR